MPKLHTFFANSKHILNISYKPSNEEFNKSARIILLGILVIGALGFVISILIGYLSGAPI
jgi:protein translocase SEC61 complex gamma subunit